MSTNSIGNYNSAGSYVWSLPEHDVRQIEYLMQRLDVSEIIARLLINRGVSEIEDAHSYLDTKLSKIMPNPYLLKDMDKAVDRIISALEKKEKITVFADYDVDGATSASLLRRFFRMLNVEVDVYIPHRINEGYGPNIEAFKKIKDGGSTLVITVDCGIVAFESMDFAQSYGLDVIIVDHHVSTDALPVAKAIINPNRLDDDFPFKSIAAVTVAFFVVTAVRMRLRETGWLEANGVNDFELIHLLDLVALGTVCDVMPLVGVNRALVRLGLDVMRQRTNNGLATLADALKIENKISSHHLGYVFGPRLNAGGRIGRGELGVELLSSDDSVRNQSIVNELEKLNNERKAIEAIAFDKAVQYVCENELEKDNFIIVIGDHLHMGVLGILASRLKDKYCKPVIVLSKIDHGRYKGSARSIEGVDIGSAIVDAKNLGFLLEGGGHKMAGGVVVSESKLDGFKEFLNDKFSEDVLSGGLFKKARTLNIDAVLSFDSINHSLMKSLEDLAPFGNGNAQPCFLIRDVVIVTSTVIINKHIIGYISDRYNSGDGESRRSRTIKFVLFNGVNSAVGSAILGNRGSVVALVCHLQVNSIYNENIELIVTDISITE